ncbi:GtrA family protein [Paraburkholderia aspalathi]|nr:GtrA family protein [Paraburkholderia aspalathi]
MLSQNKSSRRYRASRLAIVYAILAVIATGANIGAQDISLRLYSDTYSVFISVAVGTIVGLVVKYALDKKYIFSFKPENAAHDAKTFIVYTSMGLITTAIFWSFEFGFNHIFHTKEARFVGAIIGLSIGYVSKYLLDRKFVFGKTPSDEPSKL